MKTAVVFLAAMLLAGCASHRAVGDPDQPRQVCPSTTIGSEAKTFCY